MEQLRAQEAAFQALEHGGRRWAQRLNTLSDRTPDGVWYNELSLDRGKGLVIQGAAVSEGGGETENISKLVQELKADPNFTEAVQDLQIESIKRVQDHDIEIVQFTLTGKVETHSP